jgi:lysozyme
MPARDTPAEARELIKSFEGIPDGDPSTVNYDAYLDPVGIWTIGWGHAVVHNGKHLKGAENRIVARGLFPGGITKAQAEALLAADLISRAPAVERLVKVPLTDDQFGALMSFTFNAGAGRLETSTLLRLLNRGDYGGAADQFLVWNKARNQAGVLIELAGLTRRRKAERALFLGEDWRAASVPVAATRSLPAARSAPGPQMPAAPSAAEQRAAAKASAARRGVKDLSAPPVKKGVSKKAAVKKAPAKKAAAKKSAAKSAPTKKARK